MSTPIALTVRSNSGAEVAMRRHTNPDGSMGGLVADDVKLPHQTFVPFDSMIGPGSLIMGGDIIPAATIIDGGRRYANNPRIIRSPSP